MAVHRTCTFTNLALEIIRNVSGVTSSVSSNKYARMLQYTVRECIDRHRHVLTSLVQRTDISESFFRGVLIEMVQDKKNWGRLITTFAFAGLLALRAVKEEKEELVDDIASWLGNFIRDKWASWIEESGGWVSVVHSLTCPLINVNIHVILIFFMFCFAGRML